MTSVRYAAAAAALVVGLSLIAGLNAAHQPRGHKSSRTEKDIRPRSGEGYNFKTIEPYVLRWVGRDIVVTCVGRISGGAFGGDRIWLDRSFCNPLAALVGGKRIATKRQGVGMIVLVHEMIHARNIWNEAKTECYAFQIVDDVSREWGVTGAWLDAILHFAYVDHRQLVRASSRYRHHRYCQEGGLWDLSPDDGVWP